MLRRPWKLCSGEDSKPGMMEQMVGQLFRLMVAAISLLRSILTLDQEEVMMFGKNGRAR